MPTLIPKDVRFPKKGDVYEALSDIQLDYFTLWGAPLTGGGKSTLFKGERVWIDQSPNQTKPNGVYAIPVEYEKLESRIVPDEVREKEDYSSFCFCIDTVVLNQKFRLV